MRRAGMGMLQDLRIDRRQFATSVITGAVGMACGGSAGTCGEPSKPLTIDEPFHGAVLNRRHGVATAQGLKIVVRGRAPTGVPVRVNGSAARRQGNQFLAEIVLRQKETDVVAVAESGASRHEDRVRVVWDRHSIPRYRFSIDDNSFFLRDIVEKGYKSLFDCFYLKGLRDLNQKYGARFVLNIYYTTGGDFSLPQFPDRYKAEWRDNAEWLRLAFHAHADKPDRPYQDAAPERLIAELDEVADQIHRFAGEQTYTPPTVIHWGMVRPEALVPLAKRGVRVLSGYFRPGQGGRWDINYRLDDRRSAYLWEHEALKDFESGIVFSRIDLVCNNTPVDRTVATLAPLAENPNLAEIMDLFTHEQYFWPFYTRYVPDHFRRLDTAIRWVHERGYKPVFFHEGFLGVQDA